jgi:hypothetical protein
MLEEHLASIDELEPLCEEAYSLAVKLFGNNVTKCRNYTGKLTEVYLQVKDKDVAVIYNGGGWGTIPMEDDAQWGGVVQGISLTLNKWGYNSLILEHQRGKEGLVGLLSNIGESLRLFPSRAAELASGVDFLVENIPHLKIVITGVSWGAIYNNEVMERLEGSPRVYGIEAGVPFWYKEPAPANTLAINDNGIVPDKLSQGDLAAMLRSYFSAPFRWVNHRLHGESVKFSDCVNVPGHQYYWNYPEVQSQIIAFLADNFGITHHSMGEVLKE